MEDTYLAVMLLFFGVQPDGMLDQRFQAVNYILQRAAAFRKRRGRKAGPGDDPLMPWTRTVRT